MNDQDSRLACEAICHAANMAKESINYWGSFYVLPSVMYRPSLSIDGNQWCALYGDNLQDGVAGFGDSPEEAMRDFNAKWCEKLPQRSAA